jgi:hypothetical protein
LRFDGVLMNNAPYRDYHNPVRPCTPAAYELWCKAGVWMIDRGCYLLVDVEEVDCPYSDECVDMLPVWEMMYLAECDLKAGILLPYELNHDDPLKSLVLPSVFIAWARLKGYSIPEQLEKIDLAVQVETMSNQDHISENLATLSKAAHKFWANADKDDKDTHPKQEVVKTWLLSQGFSDISATQGAVIIRPEWAAKSGRPKE